MRANQPEPTPGQRSVVPSEPPRPRGTLSARGSASPMAQGRIMEPSREGEGSLAHVVETLLDKGLVLNADIMVSVAGVELLGIRLRAALASFETASRYGLEFPAGTDTETAAWRETRIDKEECPQCGKRSPTQQLLEEWCPWCGWRSAQSLENGRGAGALTADGDGDGTAGGTRKDARDDSGKTDADAENTENAENAEDAGKSGRRRTGKSGGQEADEAGGESAGAASAREEAEDGG
ncbi:gas vesicle protein [Streptomyces sp. NPDC007088]|uniref:gas vesicle protein n=1 Tax=Streptomyces sp. NPDC007088 TaxID=3364773 RepID=UPI003681106C